MGPHLQVVAVIHQEPLHIWPTHLANSTKLTIQIPAPSTIHHSGPVTKNEPDTVSQQTHTVQLNTMMSLTWWNGISVHILWSPGMLHQHLNVLRPGQWSKHEFCVQHNLWNLCAYIWENWYQPAWKVGVVGMQWWSQWDTTPKDNDSQGTVSKAVLIVNSCCSPFHAVGIVWRRITSTTSVCPS